MSEIKITKRNCYSELLGLIDYCEAQGVELQFESMTYEALKEHIENEINLLDNKAEAARKRAEKKREEGDELREKIYGVLDDNYMILDDIVKLLGDVYTPQKITPRISQLVKLGRVEKGTVSVESKSEDGKTERRTAYKRIG